MTLSDEIRSYLLSIDELRRTYDIISHTYGSIRTKILTFSGGGLALLTYLYRDGNRENINLPDQNYGVIIYFIGLVCIIVAIATLLYATLPVTWQFPTENKILKSMKFNSYIDFLKYTQGEYIDAISINVGHCEKKQKYLNFAFPLLIVGAILLVVIKSFQ